MNSILLIALGGALGSLSRYFLHLKLSILFSGAYALATATTIVNILGCFAMGVLAAFLLNKISNDLTLLIGVGFLGSFTTFSAFTFETLKLLQQDLWQAALYNTLLSITLTLFATMVGFKITMLFFPNN